MKKKRLGVKKYLDHPVSLSIATVAASLLGVLTSLLVPFFLHANEYARYSVMFGFSQLLSSIVFEWARVSIIRYAYIADTALGAVRRHVLSVAYLILFIFLILCAAFFLLLALVWPTSMTISVVLFSAALQGVFDGRQAATRAQAKNWVFAICLINRSLIALFGVLGGSLLFRTGEAALLGFVISYPITSIIGLAEFQASIPRLRFNRRELVFLFRFGALAAVGTNLSLGIPAMFRGLIVRSLGLSDAAGLLLAIDISQRVFAVVGSSISIVTVQNLIKAAEFHEAAFKSQLRFQILSVAYIVIPSVIALSLLLKPIANIIPSIYRVSFTGGAVFSVLAVGFIAIRQYSLDPMFVVYGKTIGAPIGPSAMLFVLLICFMLSQGGGGESIQTVAFQLVLSSFIGICVTALSLTYLTPIVWPLSDIAKLLLASVMTLLAGAIFPEYQSSILIFGKMLIQLLIFAGGLFVLQKFLPA